MCLGHIHVKGRGYIMQFEGRVSFCNQGDLEPIWGHFEAAKAEQCEKALFMVEISIFKNCFKMP